MARKKPAKKGEWVDPDDAPELTKEWFERAEIWHGDKLIRPGRPPANMANAHMSPTKPAKRPLKTAKSKIHK